MRTQARNVWLGSVCVCVCVGGGGGGLCTFCGHNEIVHVAF